jgi:hypothetical protein
MLKLCSVDYQKYKQSLGIKKGGKATKEEIINEPEDSFGPEYNHLTFQPDYSDSDQSSIHDTAYWLKKLKIQDEYKPKKKKKQKKKLLNSSDFSDDISYQSVDEIEDSESSTQSEYDTVFHDLKILTDEGKVVYQDYEFDIPRYVLTDKGRRAIIANINYYYKSGESMACHPNLLPYMDL